MKHSVWVCFPTFLQTLHSLLGMNGMVLLLLLQCGRVLWAHRHGPRARHSEGSLCTVWKYFLHSVRTMWTFKNLGNWTIVSFCPTFPPSPAFFIYSKGIILEQSRECKQSPISWLPGCYQQWGWGCYSRSSAEFSVLFINASHQTEGDPGKPW
jgi:hypothetical protein